MQQETERQGLSIGILLSPDDHVMSNRECLVAVED